MKILFTFEEWQEILREFSEKVDKKQCYRIPYDKWKRMNCNYVEAYYDSLQNVIQLDLHNPGVHCDFIEFPMSAGGFGDFLYFNYMKKWEDRTSSITATSNMDSNTVKLKLDNNTLYLTLDDGTISGVNEMESETAISSSLTTISKADYISTGSVADSISTVIETKVDYDDYISTVKALNNEIKDIKKSIEKKEEKDMKNFNYDFGPVNTNVVKLSMYGLAIKDKTGSFVSYDAKNNEIMNVDILNFEGAGFLYKMPVAIKDVAIGDVVIHQNIPMFVIGISADQKTLTAVDPVAGERKEIMLTRSPFGFNFATKIVNLIGDMMGSPSADNPFGNMWMLMALQGDTDMTSMLPLMLMNQNSNMDPMMMMLFMNGGKMDANSVLPFMMMMNQNKPVEHKCTCGGACNNN